MLQHIKKSRSALEASLMKIVSSVIVLCAVSLVSACSASDARSEGDRSNGAVSEKSNGNHDERSGDSESCAKGSQEPTSLEYGALEIKPGEVDWHSNEESLIVVTYASNHPTYTQKGSFVRSVIDCLRTEEWRRMLAKGLLIHYIDLAQWPKTDITMRKRDDFYDVKYGLKGFSAKRLPDVTLYSFSTFAIDSTYITPQPSANEDAEKWVARLAKRLNRAFLQRQDREGKAVAFQNSLLDNDYESIANDEESFDRAVATLANLSDHSFLDSAAGSGKVIQGAIKKAITQAPNYAPDTDPKRADALVQELVALLLPLSTPKESESKVLVERFPNNPNDVLGKLLDSALERLEFHKWTIPFKRRYDREYGQYLRANNDHLLPVLRIAATAYAKAPQESYVGDARYKLFQALKILFAQHLELHPLAHGERDPEHTFLNDLATIVDRVRTLPEGEQSSHEFDLYSDLRLMDYYLNTKLAR